MREFLDILPKLWEKKRALNASEEKEKPDDSKKISAKEDVSEDYLELVKSIRDIEMQCQEDIKKGNTVFKKTTKAIKAIKVKIRCILLFTDIHEKRNLEDTYCDVLLMNVIKRLVDIYIMYNKVNKAEEWCKMNIEFMKGQELTPKYIILAIVTQLQLNDILDIKNAPSNERYACLKTAMILYCTYTAKETYPTPFLHDKFNNGCETNPNIILDSLHISTLEELIKIFIFHPREKHEFVLYMHKLLKDTMEEALLQSGHLEWSVTCANLVFYFIYHNRFCEAKSHLLIASKILFEFFDTKVTNIKTDKTSDLEITTIKDELYLDAIHSVNLLWVQYGLELFRISHEKLLQGEDISNNNLLCEVDNSNLTALLLFDTTSEPVMIQNVNESVDYQSFTDQYLKNFDDVLKLYNLMEGMLRKAESYFDQYTKLYRLGETYLYVSRLCKYMSYFDKCFSKDAKWPNIRIQILENAIKKLDESTDSHVKCICQALHLELGLAYCTSLDKDEEKYVRTGEDLNKKTTVRLHETVKKIVYCFKRVEIYDHELKNLHNAENEKKIYRQR